MGPYKFETELNHLQMALYMGLPGVISPLQVELELITLFGTGVWVHFVRFPKFFSEIPSLLVPSHKISISRWSHETWVSVTGQKTGEGNGPNKKRSVYAWFRDQLCL